jgi:large subunit ribosomal protein L31
LKIRILGDSFNFLPQVYPQLLWISGPASERAAGGSCGGRQFNYSDIKVTCSCGNEFTTRSTLGEDLMIEVCSSCHPFYTGKQKIVDTGGRVDKFRRKYGMSSA